jgi:hypothetical protein
LTILATKLLSVQTKGNTASSFWSATALSLPVFFLLICFILCLYWSWHWPLFLDPAIMHYVVFLMDHGMAPYRDIIDINMPAAYMIEWTIVHVFGGGPAALRFFDILTMLVAISAACWIAVPYDWRAGAVGGLGLSLFHLSIGPVDVAERDWFLMVLLLLGYAFLFHALRTHRPWCMGLFAVATGAAASVKPLAIPFPFLLLLLAWLILRRREIAFGPYLRWALLGACIPILASLLFLWRWQAFGAFFTIVHGLMSFYTGIGNLPQKDLLHILFGRFLWTMTVCGVFAGVLVKSWKNYEANLLALGIVFGAILYFGQRKGFPYHKGTLIAFLILWISIQFYLGLRQRGAARLLSALSLVAFCLGAGAFWTRAVPASHFDETGLFAWQHDLEALGGPALSGQVQCLEMGAGCITDLYRMRLLQPTGFISDFFVFTSERIPILEALKSRFLSEVHARPPRVIILVASEWGSDHVSYSQLDNWPALRTFLAQDYTLYKEKRRPDGSLDRESYQIYLKN